MGVQDLFTYLIVGIAALVAARSFLRQFTAKGGTGCSKCPQCRPEKSAGETETLIEIEQNELTKSE
ncbi:uncharacterized protein METZ01_LOCUS359256 [marine metagenome]|uniref:FeoB-associated Cys-rich membrane protein n=1 Tax=marine metagenome TaxID=408172 RepID=A0A382SA12_9ZZZZ